MIELNAAKRQIAKLGLANLQFPPDIEGMVYLAAALAKHALSEAHAGLVVDGWIENLPQWPKPSEIIQVCGSIPDPAAETVRGRRSQCRECSGTGWKIMERGGVEGAVRCECSAVTT